MIIFLAVDRKIIGNFGVLFVVWDVRIPRFWVKLMILLILTSFEILKFR